MDQEFVEKKSNGKIIGIIVVILILILALGGGFYYLFFVRVTPKSYLNEVSTKTTGYVEDILDTFSDFKTNNELKTIKNKGSLKFNVGEELEVLKDCTIDYDFITSYQDEKLRLNIDLKEKNESFLEGDFYLDKDSLYVNSKDLYDKVIRLMKSDTNVFSSMKELMKETYTIDDVKIIVESYMKYYFEALKEIDMESSNISFTDVKYTYNITEANMKKVQDKFKELCEKDSKLKNIIKEQDFNTTIGTGLKNTKIEVQMNRFTKDISNITISNDKEKNEIIKIEKGKYEVNKEDKIIITDSKFTYEDYEDNKLDSTLEIEKTKDGISFKVTTSEVNMEFSLRKASEKNIRLSLKGENKTDTKVSFDFDMDIKFEGETTTSKLLATVKSDEISFGIEMDNVTHCTNEKVEELDVSNAIAIDDLKEEDTNKITENLFKKILESSLGDLLVDNPNL